MEIIEDKVKAIEADFNVWLACGELLRARKILIATGLHDVLPEIPGVRERWGRDLLHCPYCHGWEVRDQPSGYSTPRPAPFSTRSWSGSGPTT